MCRKSLKGGHWRESSGGKVLAVRAGLVLRQLVTSQSYLKAGYRGVLLPALLFHCLFSLLSNIPQGQQPRVTPSTVGWLLPHQENPLQLCPQAI